MIADGGCRWAPQAVIAVAVAEDGSKAACAFRLIHGVYIEAPILAADREQVSVETPVSQIAMISGRRGFLLIGAIYRR